MFFLQIAAKNRVPNQSPADWRKAVHTRLQPTTVSLHRYGGGKLAIVRQAQCLIAREGYEVDAILQVQMKAPVDLLLGTDVLPPLGISLTCQRMDHPVDLLGCSPNIQLGQRPELSSAPQDTPTELPALGETPPDLSTPPHPIPTATV